MTDKKRTFEVECEIIEIVRFVVKADSPEAAAQCVMDAEDAKLLSLEWRRACEPWRELPENVQAPKVVVEHDADWCDYYDIEWTDGKAVLAGTSLGKKT